eukprot:108957-Amphidinium_carterae.3
MAPASRCHVPIHSDAFIPVLQVLHDIDAHIASQAPIQGVNQQEILIAHVLGYCHLPRDISEVLDDGS